MDKAIAYSFLAAIKEKKGNITSLIEIYDELVEALVMKLFSKKTKGGLLRDFQGYFSDSYGISIPIPTIKIIFSRIVENKKGKIDLFSDSSFTINEIEGENLDSLIEAETDNVEEIFEMYNTYLESRGLEKKEWDLMEYIEQIKRHLVKYLAGEIDLDISGQVQAEYIKEIIAIPKYQSIVNKLFLGSIISSYFDLDIDESTKDEKLFLLDTNFVISLLGLHSEDSQDNCKMIVEIAQKLNYKVEILPFTIEEIKSLLLRIASTLNNSTYFQSQDRNSIYYGCFRNRINSDGLVMIANKFSERLSTEYHITIIDYKIDSVLRDRAQKSDIYASLKHRQNNPDGALHDAAALLYVREHRKGIPSSFKDIISWFVSDTKGISENAKVLDKNAPLIIRAEEMLNILWLTHPIIDEKALSKNIVLKAITSTLSQKLPNKKMLKDMDRTIDTIKDYTVNTLDCVKVAENIACYDNTELKLIMEKEHQKEVLDELHKAAIIAEDRKQKENDQVSEFWQKARQKIEESARREVAYVKIKAAKERGEIEMEKNNIVVINEIKNTELLIERDKEDMQIVENDIKNRILEKTEKQANILFFIIGITNFAIFLLVSILIIKYWSKVEPYMAVLPIVPVFITYIVGVLKYKEFNIIMIIKEIKEKVLLRNKNRNKKLLERREVLEKRVEENIKKINKLREQIVY